MVKPKTIEASTAGDPPVLDLTISIHICCPAVQPVVVIPVTTSSWPMVYCDPENENVFATAEPMKDGVLVTAVVPGEKQ